jgi:hypothetical protein
MTKAVIDRSLIAHQADPRTAQQIDLLGEQSFNAQIYRFPVLHIHLWQLNHTAPNHHLR